MCWQAIATAGHGIILYKLYTCTCVGGWCRFHRQLINKSMLELNCVVRGSEGVIDLKAMIRACMQELEPAGVLYNNDKRLRTRTGVCMGYIQGVLIWGEICHDIR